MVAGLAEVHADRRYFAKLGGAKPITDQFIMRLRFIEDRRTLLWAFVLFPSVPIAVYARPGLGPWLLPLALYLSYCAGVLTHNQNHCPTFVGRRANLFYGAWLSIFYGFPIFSWIPTHNQNHHRFLNGEGDATRTSRLSARNTLLVALIYPLASSRWQLDGIRTYVAGAMRDNPSRFRRILLEFLGLAAGHAALLALALALHGVRVGALSYALSVGLPALTATYWMMFTNYLQHVDCEPSSPDDHSRNFVSPFFNWFVFDNGLHTVHHEHPGVHWSRYRALHEARGARIAPHLNQNSLFRYVFDEYLVKASTKRDAGRAASSSQLPDCVTRPASRATMH
jgi:beta-carotene hydroxylase